MTKPQPISSYEVCKGESPQGTHICIKRDDCKRYMPAGYRGNYKNFWMATNCIKYESKVGEEAAGLDW